jgi:hypothetical protein
LAAILVLHLLLSLPQFDEPVQKQGQVHAREDCIMQIELYCPDCCCRFVAAPETSASVVVTQMADRGPWVGLGDGETFEDMIFTALSEHGSVSCPDCGEEALVREESLGRLAMDVLTRW